MLTITHLTNKAIAVTGLPEGAYISGVQGSELYYWLNYGSYDIGDYPKSIHLPPGNWTILGFSQDLKEEDWKQVVEAQGFIGFVDYTPSKGSVDISFYDTALLSSHSLLKSKDLDPLLNHLILIQ